jgi:ureidoacrylate peracid hydrolase
MASDLPIEPNDTGLLVVDIQNAFVHPEGVQARAGFDMTAYPPIVAKIRKLVEACHACGMRVFWSRQIHHADDVTRERRKLPSHVTKLGMIPGLRGSWDSEILDELQPLITEDDEVFEKHRASCFYSTTLEAKLRMYGITGLIVTGVTTNYCVEHTIRDAYARDLDLFVVEDACASPWQDLHEATIRNVEIFFGSVVTTRDVLSGLGSVSLARRGDRLLRSRRS